MTIVRIDTPEEARLLRVRGRKFNARPEFVRDADGNTTGVQVDLPDQAAAAAKARIDAHRAAPPGQ